jgi:hypothetical protein
MTTEGKHVRCSPQHLFETTDGWQKAEDLVGKLVDFITYDGIEQGAVAPTGKMIPIVDITVDHENHRYYTNGVSSHNSGGGKSLFMTHVAASTLKQGKNVLYISMEMSEERIAERVDANLMKVDISKLGEMSKDTFMTKIDKIRAKTNGRLFVKEYPTGSAHAGHFRALLGELKVKQNFTADLIVVDYLGICASSRMKMGGSVNSYSYIKAVAEELRGLAVEFSVPILTGAQFNRSGFGNSDVDLTSTADSMGIVQTLDMMFALIRTDELDDQGSIMIKQLKNRYSDPGMDKRFLLGLDRPKMTFFDLADSAQAGIGEESKDKTFSKRKPDPDVPLFDKSNNSKTLNTSNFKF